MTREIAEIFSVLWAFVILIDVLLVIIYLIIYTKRNKTSKVVLRFRKSYIPGVIWATSAALIAIANIVVIYNVPNNWSHFVNFVHALCQTVLLWIFIRIAYVRVSK
jgi:hypothetical protein